MKTWSICITTIGLLLTATHTFSATRNHWVEGQSMSNGAYRNGHFRIYDYLSYKYPNNTSFWTVTGEYYRQNQGTEKEPYYQGTISPEAKKSMDKTLQIKVHAVNETE